MKGMNLTKSGKVGLGMPKRRVAGDVSVKVSVKVRKPRCAGDVGDVKVRKPRCAGDVG